MIEQVLNRYEEAIAHERLPGQVEALTAAREELTLLRCAAKTVSQHSREMPVDPDLRDAAYSLMRELSLEAK